MISCCCCCCCCCCCYYYYYYYCRRMVCRDLSFTVFCRSHYHRN